MTTLLIYVSRPGAYRTIYLWYTTRGRVIALHSPITSVEGNPPMDDDTDIEWHRAQIAKNRTLIEELEAGGTVGGDVLSETQAMIDRLKD